MTGQNEEKRSLRGLPFDEQKKLSGFATISATNSCMRLGDIAHDLDPGWQNLFQAKIDSARKDGFSAYVIHEGDWHGYYESKTKECSMGICSCREEKGASPSSFNEADEAHIVSEMASLKPHVEKGECEALAMDSEDIEYRRHRGAVAWCREDEKKRLVRMQAELKEMVANMNERIAAQRQTIAKYKVESRSTFKAGYEQKKRIQREVAKRLGIAFKVGGVVLLEKKEARKVASEGETGQKNETGQGAV